MSPKLRPERVSEISTSGSGKTTNRFPGSRGTRNQRPCRAVTARGRGWRRTIGRAGGRSAPTGWHSRNLRRVAFMPMRAREREFNHAAPRSQQHRCHISQHFVDPSRLPQRTAQHCACFDMHFVDAARSEYRHRRGQVDLPAGPCGDTTSVWRPATLRRVPGRPRRSRPEPGPVVPAAGPSVAGAGASRQRRAAVAPCSAPSAHRVAGRRSAPCRYR